VRAAHEDRVSFHAKLSHVECAAAAEADSGDRDGQTASIQIPFRIQ
jgi:hypothetical protein